MAGSNYQDGGGAIAEINVTPLVDVVLVLLVIFMVTAPMIAAQGILVDSPAAATGVSVQSTMTLSIREDGVLVVTNEKEEHRFAANNRLAARPLVEAFHKAHPDSKAIIAADKDITHGSVMEVIDMVRQAGVEKFALRTKIRLDKKDEDATTE